MNITTKKDLIVNIKRFLVILAFYITIFVGPAVIFNYRNANISNRTGAITSISTNIELQALLKAHNDIRRSNGLEPLQLSSELTTASNLKGQVMLENNCWSHYCNGIEPWYYFEKAGYDYKYAGENLAEGFFDVESVMKAWINSPTHYENIINPNFKDVGFSILHGTFQGSENNEIIVVHFGSL